MWPTLAPGDEVRLAAQPSYSIGDMVAFDNGRPSLVVHRVVAIQEGQIQTRGDHLLSCDPWHEKEMVVGVVVAVKRHGLRRLLGVAALRWLAEGSVRPLQRLRAAIRIRGRH
jgi:hypothetical protein